MIKIYTGGAIEGGGFTLYGHDRAMVRQTRERTLVLVARNGSDGFVELSLPSARYALSCDAPASGVPGRADFERDFLAAV